MKSGHEINNLLAQALVGIRAGEFSDAQAYLELAHQKARDKPLYHAQIHAIWFYAKMRSCDVFGMLTQVFPVIFAIPVSLFNLFKKSFSAQQKFRDIHRTK